MSNAKAHIIPKVRLFFGRQRVFSIETLFNWNFEAGWEHFWSQGKTNVAEESRFYETLNEIQQGRDEGDDDGPTRVLPTTSEGAKDTVRDVIEVD